jgi:hypothetical protein
MDEAAGSERLKGPPQLRQARALLRFSVWHDSQIMVSLIGVIRYTTGKKLG